MELNVYLCNRFLINSFYDLNFPTHSVLNGESSTLKMIVIYSKWIHGSNEIKQKWNKNQLNKHIIVFLSRKRIFFFHLTNYILRKSSQILVYSMLCAFKDFSSADTHLVYECCLKSLYIHIMFVCIFCLLQSTMCKTTCPFWIFGCVPVSNTRQPDSYFFSINHSLKVLPYEPFKWRSLPRY